MLKKIIEKFTHNLCFSENNQEKNLQNKAT